MWGNCTCGELWEANEANELIEARNDGITVIDCAKCNVVMSNETMVYGCFKSNLSHMEPKYYCQTCFEVLYVVVFSVLFFSCVSHINFKSRIIFVGEGT